MTAKALTAAAVEQYRPAAKRRVIRDLKAQSLYLVIHPSGQKSWMMRFRTPGGRVAKMVLGPLHAGGELAGAPVIGMPLTLVAARQLAAEVHRQRALGQDVIEQHKARRRRPEEKAPSFSDLAIKFIEQHARPNTRGWKDTARLLGLDYPNDGPPTEIAGGLAQRWKKGTVSEHDVFAVVEEARAVAVPGIEPRRMGPNETRAIALFAALSTAFKWLKARRLIDVDPTIGIRQSKAPKARDRVLSSREIVAFWAAASAERVEFAAPLKLLLLTGQRLNEVAGMRRDELSDDGATWTIPSERTKNGRVHVVPLPPMARELISSVAELSTEFVFSTEGKSPVTLGGRMKRRLDQAMGIPHWRLHDLRRTAVTRMVDLKVPPHVVELVVNHAGGFRAGVAGTYIRSEMIDERRAALELWASHVAGIISNKIVPLHGRRA
jgi:integrase